MNKPAKKKQSRIIRLLITALTVVLIFLFFDIMSLVSDIQGTARVVNYAGLVRGTTQRIVKMEDAQEHQDKLIEAVDSYIDGLRYGSEQLDLVRLDDDEFQAKTEELDTYYDTLTAEIDKVREKGYENTNIISMSETFFGICDTATKLAEDYSQEKATALNQLEMVVIADITGLVLLFGVEIIRALRVATLNRALQKKVYLDEATGLFNKNKCEELLGDPDPVSVDNPLALCMFDLNNLRTINNNLGHGKGDEYIRSFALQLKKIESDSCFVGREGGDEFIAILKNATKETVETCLAKLKAYAAEYSEEHPEMPISYAAGFALSSDFDSCTMRDLFREADKNMYIDKNHAKVLEEENRRNLERSILADLRKQGYHFTECLYCDALLDQYRILQASSRGFLAKEGSYSGAVEQIAQTLFADNKRKQAKSQLQPENLANVLTGKGHTIEMFYSKGEHKGRITLAFLDSANGTLHHFILGAEPFFESSSNEKERLSRYYDQMKQSIMDNSDYVDALLSSAQTAYSVDLTHDTLEKAFSQETGRRRHIPLEPPCSYERYCQLHSCYVTPKTLESYRLVDTSEKLLKRFAAGTNQLTIEYQELGIDDKPIWLQKTVLMSHDVMFDDDTQTETSMVRGIILFKDTSAFHEQEQEERKQLEAALQTADAESKAKTEFMNRMSHDFRTPINGIMGMLEIIHKNKTNQAKTDECLSKIQVSTNHLLALVNDVLDMNKLESGEEVLRQESFDIEELMDEVRTLLDAQIVETEITHRSHRSNITHTKLIGSPLRVRQIMLNLFSNAIKYNKQKGSIDTYATEISHDDENALFEFSITDTGIGMSQDFVANQLFKPFTQEQFGARTHYKGTGLGMSIVKALVDKMGGSIKVSSVRGEGTTFTFRLPFKIDASSKASQQEETEQNASLENLTILVAEDNDINMEIAEFYLTSAGAKVDTAYNGLEAVQKFESSPEGSYSLILMDLMMPEMDGLEATRIIRSSTRSDAQNIPIAAMTAKAFDEDKQKSIEAGMDAYLIKPINMNELIAVCDKLCR